MADYTFNTPEPVELEVKIPAGDIEIETVDGDESSVSVEGPRQARRADARRARRQPAQVELETQEVRSDITISIGDCQLRRAAA